MPPPMKSIDLNSKIIEAVKLKPILYGHGSKEERESGWRDLSEELKVKEQNIKIRWHFLVNAYRTDDCFKYANEMNFIERNVKIKVKSDTWPEFNITEDDIAEKRTHTTEEYVFLEVDDLESTVHHNNPPNSLEELKYESIDKQKKFNEVAEIYEERSSATVASDKPNITVPSESTPVTKTTASDRCEDVIFGELVTAMLKRMEEDKKRNIKKEIMNLLLT